MAEEVIKEVNNSTHAPAESKRDIWPISTTEIIHGSVPPYLRRKEKPVPHYRRASTGSCHDSCKFGTRHSFESKKDLPVRGWRQDRANARHGKQDQAEVIQPGGKAGNKDRAPKISSLVNPEFNKQKPQLKVVPDHSETSPYIELQDEVSELNSLIMPFDDQSNCGDGELSEGAVSIDLEMPLAIQDSDEYDDHVMDAILPSEYVHEAVEQSLVDHVSGHSAVECVSSEKRSDQTVVSPEKHKKNKLGTKSVSFSLEPVKQKTEATLTITRNTMSNHKTGVKPQRKAAAGTSVESSDGPRITVKKEDVSATNKSKGEKKFELTVASTFLKLKEIKVPSPASATDSSAKSTRLSKTKASTSKIALAPPPPSGKQTGRKITLENIARKDSLLGQKNGEEKVTTLSPLKLSRSVNMSAKSLSSPKMRAAKKATSASPMKSKKVYVLESSSDCKEKIVQTGSPKIGKPDVKNKERQSQKGTFYLYHSNPSSTKMTSAKKETSSSPVKSKKVYKIEGSSDCKGKIVKIASPKIRKPDVSNKERQSPKEKAVTARTESAGRPKSASISLSTMMRSPRKLTFRRGKVLTNLASNSDNNSPRRVRFRPAKATDDGNISKNPVRVRITRKSGTRASVASRDSGASGAEVVVLRHQDANEKKSEQRSFNKVIKEAASRLIQARKSKVKALVGAFETVISLQEKQGRSSSVSV